MAATTVFRSGRHGSFGDVCVVSENLTYKLHVLLTMKIRPKDSTQPQIFKPNPPSKQAIQRAQFKDKTFHWNGGVRSGNKRLTK